MIVSMMTYLIDCYLVKIRTQELVFRKVYGRMSMIINPSIRFLHPILERDPVDKNHVSITI